MSSHLTYKVVSTLRLPTQEDPTVVSIDPEGTFIAAGSADGSVFVWRLRTYELLCQASPPPNGQCLAGTCVTNMTWVSNGLLAFSRRNGLMGTLLVEKVREPAWRTGEMADSPLLLSVTSEPCPSQPTSTYRYSQWTTATRSISGQRQPIMR